MSDNKEDKGGKIAGYSFMAIGVLIAVVGFIAGTDNPSNIGAGFIMLFGCGLFLIGLIATIVYFIKGSRTKNRIIK